MRKYRAVAVAAKQMRTVTINRDQRPLELVCIALAVALMILAARIVSVL